MVKSKSHDDFLSLVRLGIGNASRAQVSENNNWEEIEALGARQGLSAVIVDGIEKLPMEKRPPQNLLLQWIGETLQNYEYRYESYKKAIGCLAGFYNHHGFKIMVLKGFACGLEWPKPEHRPYGDIDIWQFGKQKEADAVLTGNTGVRIDKGQHHHTVFEWQGFMAENHYDFINIRHHPSHRGLETIFKELGKDDSNFVEMTDASTGSATKVYLPSPNLHALFLLRHALNHFASIGINLRIVLDWAFYIGKHAKEIDWKWLEAVIDEYHMRDFYNCLNAICVEDLGFSASIFPSVQFLPSLKEKVLNDILHPKFTIDEPDGILRKWIHKYRRWKGNRWKQELCYKESAWYAFLRGLMIHFVKPN